MPHADVSVVVGTVVRTRYFPQIPHFKTPAFLLCFTRKSVCFERIFPEKCKITQKPVSLLMLLRSQLGETSPKWPILCRLGRKTTTWSMLHGDSWQARSVCVVCQLVAADSDEKFLRFAALPWGCETYDCITLVNRGLSNIPVRLVISSVPALIDYSI